MSFDEQIMNYLEENQRAINEYWSLENSESRLSEISINHLTNENEWLKKQNKKQQEEILALKKELRLLKGLPEEEPPFVELAANNGLTRCVNGIEDTEDKFYAGYAAAFDEVHEVDEELENFDFVELDAVTPVRQYNRVGLLNNLKTFEEEFRKIEQAFIEVEKYDEESAIPIGNCCKGMSSSWPLVSSETFIRVGKLGDDSPLRHETPNPKLKKFNC